MNYRQPRAPTQDELRKIATAAHLVGIAIERQRAQEDLRKSELRFRSLFESAPVGMVITDEKVRHINRATQTLVG